MTPTRDLPAPAVSGARASSVVPVAGAPALGLVAGRLRDARPPLLVAAPWAAAA